MCEIVEWGRTLSTKGTDACVFNARETEEAKYIILVRENPYHRFDEIILHELSHIAKRRPLTAHFAYDGFREKLQAVNLGNSRK